VRSVASAGESVPDRSDDDDVRLKVCRVQAKNPGKYQKENKKDQTERACWCPARFDLRVSLEEAKGGCEQGKGRNGAGEVRKKKLPSVNKSRPRNAIEGGKKGKKGWVARRDAPDDGQDTRRTVEKPR